MRRDVGLVAVAEVHRQSHVAARRRQRVDPDLVGVGDDTTPRVTSAFTARPSACWNVADECRGATGNRIGLARASCRLDWQRGRCSHRSVSDNHAASLPRRPVVTAASPPVPIQRELWPLFVLVAAVLLALEGVLYWRRQTGARLRMPSVTGDQWGAGAARRARRRAARHDAAADAARWVDRLNVVFLLDHSDSVSLVAGGRERAYRFVPEASSTSRAATGTR